MKKTLQTILILSVIAVPLQLSAYMDFNFGVGGSYNLVSGPYMDNVKNNLPFDVNKKNFSLDLSIFMGQDVQFGAIFGYNFYYSYKGTEKARRVGEQWVPDASETHDFNLNFNTISALLCLKIYLIRNFFVGAGTGYQLIYEKQQIDGHQAGEFGDNNVTGMLMTGYEFEISKSFSIGLSLKVMLGFANEHKLTTVMPGVTFLFGL